MATRIFHRRESGAGFVDRKPNVNVSQNGPRFGSSRVMRAPSICGTQTSHGCVWR